MDRIKKYRSLIQDIREEHSKKYASYHLRSEIIEENEVIANRAISFISIIYVLLPMAIELGFIFEEAKPLQMANRWFFIPMAFVTAAIYLIAKKREFKGAWIKYVLIGQMILISSFSFFIFSTQTTYLLLIPVFCAIRYFNPKLMIIMGSSLILLFLLICVLSVILDKTSAVMLMVHESTAYNIWAYLPDVIFFLIIPVFLVLLFLGLYTKGIVRSGRRMLFYQAELEESSLKTELEMKTAAAIQQNGLPKNEYLTDNRNFAITGGNLQTKLVGGDFYDYFMADDRTLVFMIADVSDKGVPAALFMMACKKAIHCAIKCTHSLKKSVELANKLICEDNESGMFVTMWIGMIDIQTGVGKYANAGHLPPMVRSLDGSVSEVINEPDLFIGNFPDQTPVIYPFRLREGEMLFLYTDGLTDARNQQGQEFGAARLKEAFQDAPKELEEAKKYLMDQVLGFVGNAEQADDMTLLLLQCHNIEVPEKFSCTVRTGIEGIKEITGRVQDILRKRNCPDEIRQNAGVILDEILCNISEYAYGAGQGPVYFKSITGGNFIRMDIEDEGTPFDPTKKEDPLFPEEPEIGGLGIWLVKNLADEISYVYENGKNHITVKVIWNI